mgnify:CR=1 FL=1
MKKLVALTMALVMTFAFGYVTMASTIGIGAGEGFSVEVVKQIDPSVDPTTINGYFGVNEQLQLSLGYTTEIEAKNFGVRYAFADNMAVTFDYGMTDDADAIELGLRYKSDLNDKLALVGVVSYTEISSDNTALENSAIGLTGQAEYKLAENVVGNLGFKYASPDKGDATTDIIAGIEFYPVEQISAYVDYTMVDDKNADNTIVLGASYSF